MNTFNFGELSPANTAALIALVAGKATEQEAAMVGQCTITELRTWKKQALATFRIWLAEEQANAEADD